MLIATVPYVGKRLHLDPDPKLNYGSGSEHANNFGSGRIRIHNPANYLNQQYIDISISYADIPNVVNLYQRSEENMNS
jgi:hypothetical protein